MSRVKRPQITIFVALLGLLAATLACSIGTARPTKPTVIITFPPAGSSFTLGQEIVVQSVAADVKGVARVELWVDGRPVHTQAVAPAATSVTASQPWTPAVVGSHVVEVRAYNEDNTSSDPAQVIVTVVEAVAGTTPVAGNTPTATPSGDTPTATPPGGNAPVPTTPTSSGGPTVTAVIGLNVRAGPGTEYPAIGGLSAGQSAQITGKNPEGTWWQIVYPPESGGRGWVSADAKYSTASNAGGVPVVEVPLLPTYTPTSTGTPTPIPTATPTPTLIPSATPIPAKPTIYTFTADRYTINAGESVTLHWDLANAKVAYLLYDSVQEGVAAPGNKTVSPASTTVYTLLARNDAGDTTAQLTITVNPAGPVVLFDFVEKAPTAHWYNNSGTVLPFPGSDVDNRGFALIRVSYQLEDGSTPGRVLETHPQWTDGGGITGEYDVNVVIQSGDKFKSTIGFLNGAGAGNAR